MADSKIKRCFDVASLLLDFTNGTMMSLGVRGGYVLT